MLMSTVVSRVSFQLLTIINRGKRSPLSTVYDLFGHYQQMVWPTDVTRHANLGI